MAILQFVGEQWQPNMFVTEEASFSIIFILLLQNVKTFQDIILL